MLMQAASLPQHSHVMSPGVELEYHNNSTSNPLVDQMLVREAAMDQTPVHEEATGSDLQLAFPSALQQADAMAAESSDQVRVPMNCVQQIH